MTIWFTPATARSVLARDPLVFGDPMQLSALEYLRDLAVARRIVAECECEPCLFCDGAGTQERTRVERFTGQAFALCEDCGGDGTHLSCRCFAGINRYAVVQTRRDLLAKWRRADRGLRRAG